MLDKTDDIAVAADRWLAQFEDALVKPDDGLLKSLFHPDSYSRDVLALSWTLQTVNGRDDILATLKAQAARASPSGFAVDPDRAAPREVTAPAPARSRRSSGLKPRSARQTESCG